MSTRPAALSAASIQLPSLATPLQRSCISKFQGGFSPPEEQQGLERPQKQHRTTQQSIRMRAGVSRGGDGLISQNRGGNNAKNTTIIVNRRGRQRGNKNTTTNQICGEQTNAAGGGGGGHHKQHNNQPKRMIL
eukprot:scaffold42_cov51-Cyclotella_meneghiniana.AAC.1